MRGWFSSHRVLFRISGQTNISIREIHIMCHVCLNVYFKWNMHIALIGKAKIKSVYNGRKIKVFHESTKAILSIIVLYGYVCNNLIAVGGD